MIEFRHLHSPDKLVPWELHVYRLIQDLVLRT